jgi:hypothetical protein
MISKSVHNHEPSQQVKRPQFKKYLINNIPKNAYQINIDTLPILFS